jgi:Uma2 family endonuclease
MPAVVESYPAHVPPEYRRKCTREDCRVLAAAGLLDLERYELIDGELVSKMGKSRLHSNVLRLLAKWLVAVFGEDFVDKEVSVRLDSLNELEPDAVVLNKPALSIQADNPTPADIRLLVEVAVPTREYDLGPKAARYAAAAIPEYWALDIDQSRIVVHRAPTPTGYQSIAAYAANEPLSPLAAPHAVLHLTSLLP